MDLYIKKAKEMGAYFAYSIHPHDIIFDDKAIIKCYYCPKYGKKATCPPRIPKINYKKLVRSYKKGLLIGLKNNFQNKDEFDKIRHYSSNRMLEILWELERIAFDKGNYYVVSFGAGSCKLCKEYSDPCRFPDKSRIPIEGIGVDVVSTIKEFGVNIQFPVKDHFYRIGLLLI